MLINAMKTQSSKVLFVVNSLAYQHASFSHSCAKIKNILPKRKRAVNTVYYGFSISVPYIVFSIKLKLARRVKILKSYLVILSY